MKLTFDVTTKGFVAAFGRKKLKQVMEAAFLKAGLHWGRTFTDKHFTRAGAQEYGYARRKNERLRPGSKSFRRYAGPAEKKAGEILPLVHSGELKQLAHTYRVTATSTSKKVMARIRLPAARKLNLLPAKYRGDIHRISAAEMTLLVDVINDELAAQYQRLTDKRRVRIA